MTSTEGKGPSDARGGGSAKGTDELDLFKNIAWDLFSQKGDQITWKVRIQSRRRKIERPGGQERG